MIKLGLSLDDAEEEAEDDLPPLEEAAGDAGAGSRMEEASIG